MPPVLVRADRGHRHRATGWCASVARERAEAPAPPSPTEKALAWLVREAWPSPWTDATLTAGLVSAGQTLTMIAESERMVIFGDGVEADRLILSWGQQATIGVASTCLFLISEQ